MAAAAAVTAYAVVLLARPLPAAAVVAVDDLGQLLAALAASLACAWTAGSATARGDRRAWSLLSAATGAWAAGQAVWSYYELVVGRDVPFPSAADAGFLLFPPLAAAGLLMLPARGASSTSGLRNLLDGMVIAGALLVLSWASSLGATVADRGTDAVATALALAYPLGDVVLLTLVLLVLSRAARAQRKVLMPLAAGLAALAAADSSFLYLTTRGEYASGDLCGLGWTSGFVLVALSARAALTARSGRGGEGAAVAPWLGLALPYLPLLPALAVVLVQLLTGDRRASAVEVLLGGVLVLLVLTRQFLTLADNRSLLRQVHAERECARHASLHDPLTALANRTLFIDRVAHALALSAREQARTTVLFCDLDDFKAVNDSLGHAAGDTVLVVTAQRLLACLRPGDTVARLGGDEFAILIEASDEPVGELAQRVVSALEAPVPLSGLLVSVTVSVGVATTLAGADDGMAAGELLRRADAAMYAAKGCGKATWTSYDPFAHGTIPRQIGVQIRPPAH